MLTYFYLAGMDKIDLFLLFLNKGSEEWAAQDGRSSLEGTQMLECVLSTLDSQDSVCVLLHI